MGDNGEVLQGIGDKWTFCGATLMEWASGFVMFMIVSLTGQSVVQVIVPMILAWVGTTVFLAATRKLFPDEERGVRNFLMSTLGVKPPDIPPPSSLQPFWSASPVRALSSDCRFVQLGLHKTFNLEELSTGELMTELMENS